MAKLPHRPVALTIAGSDSGGGAGIQADLKTFASLGVHGTTAVTCITAQNPRSVQCVHGCPAAILRQQIKCVFQELSPRAVKTGMLFAPGLVEVVVHFFRRGNRPPLVVDPVAVATSGKTLLRRGSFDLIRRDLLPLATLVTPNVFEAQALLGRSLRSVEDLRLAARELNLQFGCAALLKGGHLPGMKEAVDIFYDGHVELLLCAPFIKGIKTHGTGCTYSAAITAYLAWGWNLPDAVGMAKRYITDAIARSFCAASHPMLNHFGAISQRQLRTPKMTVNFRPSTPT